MVRSFLLAAVGSLLLATAACSSRSQQLSIPKPAEELDKVDLRGVCKVGGSGGCVGNPGIPASPHKGVAVVVTDEQGKFVAVAVSDDEGRFSIRLRPGTYRVQAEHERQPSEVETVVVDPIKGAEVTLTIMKVYC